MKKVFIALSTCFFVACSTTKTNFHAQETYQKREDITTSLFASDAQQISNEAAEQILKSKITIPKDSRAALLKLPNSNQAIRYYGYNYWRSEDYMDLQQKYVDLLSSQILETSTISTTVALPSFITSEKMTLPQMREAAIRLQANLLIIYKLESDTFDNYRFLQSNQVKAFSTCEVAVLDTKTGIIPFTNVVTKKHLLNATPDDTGMSETRKKAEIEVSTLCLKEMGASITKYFNEI